MKSMIVVLTLALAAPTVRAEEKSIAIGVVLPLSGHTANFGTEALRGINLAVEQINAGGGVKGRTLDLMVRDNTGTPAATSQAAAELINQQQVLAIVGPITSTDAAAAAAVAQQAKTPLILPTATSSYVTEIGEYVCRICFTDPFQSQALAAFSRRHLKADRAAIIFEKGSSYSEELAEFYAMRFKEMGGTVVHTASFPHEPADVSNLVRQALQAGPDLLFAPVYYPEAALIINALAAAKSQVTLLGRDGWESPELFRLAGSSIRPGQVYISSHFSPEVAHPRGSQYVEDFKRAYGERPNSVSALGYDAIMVLADALRRATTMTRDGLQQALVSIDRYPGVTGAISINEKRDVVKDVYILKALPDGFVNEDVISPF